MSVFLQELAEHQRTAAAAGGGADKEPSVAAAGPESSLEKLQKNGFNINTLVRSRSRQTTQPAERESREEGGGGVSVSIWRDKNLPDQERQKTSAKETKTGFQTLGRLR